jgi:hypothetical protein
MFITGELYPILATYTHHEIGGRPFAFLKSNFKAASWKFRFNDAAAIVHWLASALEGSDELYER